MPRLCRAGRRRRSEVDRPASVGGVYRAVADSAPADAAVHGEGADRPASGGYLLLREDVPEARRSGDDSAAALARSLSNSSNPPFGNGGWVFYFRRAVLLFCL